MRLPRPAPKVCSASWRQCENIEEQVVSMDDNRDERKRETRSADRALDRRSILLGSTAFAAASALWTSAAQAQAAQAQKPNILFMLVDNLGYGELGVYGGGATRGAPTPRIDRLASESPRLTHNDIEAACTAR